MKPASQRALSFLISFGFLVAAAILYGMFIVPTNESIQQLRGAVILKSTELKKQESVLNDLNELLKNFNDLAGAQEYMSLSLPSEPKIDQVVNSLSTLAQINNILIKNLSTQASVSKKDALQPAYVQNLGTLRTNLTVSGTYDNLKSFIQKIEQNVRIMDVMQIGITEEKTQNISNSTSTPASVYAFTLDIKAYFQESAKAPAAVAAPVKL